MLFLTVVLAFVSSWLLFRTILEYLFRNKQIIKKRLIDISKADSEIDSELSKSLFIRVLKPLLDSVGKSVMKVTPRELTSSLEKKIIMAGNPKKLTVNDIINIQLTSVVFLPLLTAAAGYSAKMGAGAVVLIILSEIGLGLVLPGFILGKIIKERQKKIQNSLPDVIDLLTVSVEAGLGFDSALIKVIDKIPGPLSLEFGNVLHEIKIGKSKKEALKGMAERIGLQDLTTFTGSIIQADQFGVGIGSVLRIQSEQMRQKRKQRAQEKAMKAPVKMLIPMVFFIFPTLFAVLLGPVVIQVMDQFMK